MEVAMRSVAGSAFLIVAICFSAKAQTYDPRYPVCSVIYKIDGSSIECSYTTMAQCQASASGRAAQCLANPNFVGASKRPVKAHRRSEPLYR
jgi:Protein of unknown function (DUF3551)